MNVSDFFPIFEFFFFSFEKMIKTLEIWIFFYKKIAHYAQEVSGESIEKIRKYDLNIFR